MRKVGEHFEYDGAIFEITKVHEAAYDIMVKSTEVSWYTKGYTYISQRSAWINKQKFIDLPSKEEQICEKIREIDKRHAKYLAEKNSLKNKTCLTAEQIVAFSTTLASFYTAPW